jgi:hypothetical protein
VAPKLKDWKIDLWLAPLSVFRVVTLENLDAVLTCHLRLTEAFFELTTLGKRSLASKYLHFHYPHLFFIYDTRAHAALRLISLRRTGTRAPKHESDKTYRSFCMKVLALRDHIEAAHGRRLSPREIDNLLLEVVRRKPQTTALGANLVSA